MKGDEDESGATATALILGDDTLLVSHIGDSSVVCVIDPHLNILKLMILIFILTLDSLAN